MQNPLSLKLESFVDLDSSDERKLDELADGSQWKQRGYHLIREGDRPENVFLLLQGWAYRYKMLPGGSRQITAYLLPGDLCDPHVFILAQMDHSIALLSDARFVSIPKSKILEISRERPDVAQALWWSAMVDEAVLRQWLVSLGQRNAYESVAHLFCELWERLRQVNLTVDGAFDLPITQEQLGDTVGLTSVHTNRTLQRMRSEGLITIEAKRLTIHDMDAMRRIAGFDPNYLHLQRRRN